MRNECEYKVLSTDLSNRLFKNRVPLSGGIELTNKCNFNCIHCYETTERICEKRQLFLTEDLLRIIDTLVDRGVISVFLTGGEAMLRKDFDLIYKYLRKKGVLTAILTNGTTITESKCRLFQKYMPRMIDISIYGASEDTYEKVSGKKGMFQKVISNLEMLKKYNIPFQLKTVLLSINKHEHLEMEQIAKEFNVPFKFFTVIRPYNDGNRKPMDYMLSIDEIVQLEKEDRTIKDYYIQKKGSRVSQELSERQKEYCTYLCRIAKNSFFISFDGILNGCVRSRRKGFDLKKGDFTQGWEYLGNTFVESRESEPFKCSKCKIMNYCDFCPGEFEIETGSPTIAPHQICKLAHARYEEFG